MSNESTERLEERIAWLERHVVEQDKVILAQGDELAKIRSALLSVRERLHARESALDPNERPPHY